MPEAGDHFGPVKMDLFRILAFGQVCLFFLRVYGQPGLVAVSLKRIPAVMPGVVFIISGALSLVPALAGHGKPLALLDGMLAGGLFLVLVGTGTSGLAVEILAINAVAAGLASGYGLLQYSGVDLFAWSRGFAGSAPPSTYGNPLFLADGLASALPIAVAGTFSGRRKIRLGSLALSLILFAGLLVSQARGAWAGAIVGLAVLSWVIWRESRNRRIWFGALGTGLAVIVLGAVVLRPPAPGGDAVFQKAHALLEQGGAGFRGRFLLWESTALLARDNPVLGAGLGEFPGHYNLYQGPLLSSPRYTGLEYHSTGHAHQDYLQMVAESGIVGLGIFLWLVVAVMAGFIRDFRMEDGSWNTGRAAALAGLLVLLVDAFFNGPLHLPPSAQLAWLLLGMSCGLPGRDAGWRPPYSHRRTPPALIFLVGLVAVLVARPFARDLVGEVYMRDAQMAMEINLPEEALGGAIDSFALSIEDRRHRFLLGRAYYLAGRYDDSAEQFALDALENPGMASAWHNLGLSLLQVGRAGPAVQAFKRAAVLDPTDSSLPGLIKSAQKALLTGKKGH